MKRDTWESGITGVVTFVSADFIRIRYWTGIANMLGEMDLNASDIADGDFTIRWSEDLTDIREYPEPEDETEAVTGGDSE